MSYAALADADRQLLSGDIEAAAASARRAIQAAGSIPAEEAFDHEGFSSFCHAVLAGALARLGQYDDALSSADLALRYFNRRGELNQDEGKLWIGAVFGRALALDGLGCRRDALVEFRKAAEMVAERQAETPGKEELLAVATERMATLGRMVAPEKPAGYKAWWEFWS